MCARAHAWDCSFGCERVWKWASVTQGREEETKREALHVRSSAASHTTRMKDFAGIVSWFFKIFLFIYSRNKKTEVHSDRHMYFLLFYYWLVHLSSWDTCDTWPQAKPSRAIRWTFIVVHFKKGHTCALIEKLPRRYSRRMRDDCNHQYVDIEFKRRMKKNEDESKKTDLCVKQPAGLWDKSAGKGLLNCMFAATCPAQIAVNQFSMYWTVQVRLTSNYA